MNKDVYIVFALDRKQKGCSWFPTVGFNDYERAKKFTYYFEKKNKKGDYVFNIVPIKVNPEF